MNIFENYKASYLYVSMLLDACKKLDAIFAILWNHCFACMADTGDDGNSSYSVAQLLAQPLHCVCNDDFV
ncbi:hypothetical protein L6452_08618 [Arctium lappa]|uniref:Uncharacterized protein n=1 Tax=Arctium lappa TaxID=4217 RepID=A0ACB9DHT3_ARCLA|nr:hypothetical protein L6452_08618 [Arctium lappa]